MKSSRGQDLVWIAVVMALVGLKLVLSFFFPGLKSPGELLLSGGLLLVYSVRTIGLRSELDSPS